MKILAIETSCDETSVAIIDENKHLLSNIIYSQIPLHREFGGVVPELAARDHLAKLMPMVQNSFLEANISAQDLYGVSYTAGPGLMGALLVGASFACGLAWSLSKPILPINHLEGHILSVMLEQDGPKFPFLVLLVSGGHTMLINAHQLGNYEVLGVTLDDAAGECLDKVAKIMGLAYPGGPQIEKLANSINENKLAFPEPMKNKGLNFSFSGLKTHARKTWESSDASDEHKAHVAKALQTSIFNSLANKSKKALEVTGLKRLVVVGGVSANKELKSMLLNIVQKDDLYMPKKQFCTDNAAMIAVAALMNYKKFSKEYIDKVIVKPRWPLSEVK